MRLQTPVIFISFFNTICESEISVSALRIRIRVSLNLRFRNNMTDLFPINSYIINKFDIF